MDFPLQYFLFFDFLVVLLVLIYVLRVKSPRRLNLKKSQSARENPSGLVNRKATVNADFSKPKASGSHLGGIKERPLTVNFNYNGHSFEAHEVLGVPAGCSLAMAEEAYQRELNQVNPQSADFLQAAILALRNR